MNPNWHALAIAGAVIAFCVTNLAGLTIIWLMYRATNDRRWLLAALVGVPGLIVGLLIFASHFCK
jgi:hypothetical protein